VNLTAEWHGYLLIGWSLTMTEQGALFAVVNDQTLCAAILASRERLVYIAPGISDLP
jgi:hypothetical protein